MWHPRILLGSRRREKAAKTELLRRANMPSIETLLLKLKLHWYGHIVRMPEVRLPRMVFYGELLQGRGWQTQSPPQRYLKDEP